MEDRSQEERKHIFAINGSPEFLNLVRELFQEEGYHVTTTNFAPMLQAIREMIGES